jgi:hypothetical protein
MPIYGATEAPSDDITVQCKCGWTGKQSALLSVATTSTVMRSCPRCCEKFVAFVPNERVLGYETYQRQQPRDPSALNIGRGAAKGLGSLREEAEDYGEDVLGLRKGRE